MVQMSQLSFMEDPNDPDKMSSRGSHPLVVIDKAAPVEHVHHGLKAEDGRLVELVILGQS